MRRDNYKHKVRTVQWYNLRLLIDRYPEAAYYVVYGERKNGKTYAAKNILLDCVQEGRTFMYVRRTHKMIVKRKMNKLFNDMRDESMRRFGSEVTYEAGTFFINEDTDPQPIGYCTSLEDCFEDKGIPYNDVKYVLFDEFIDYWYMQNEIEYFVHTVANIVRDEERQGVKIIMMGNTITKSCPYFDYFGIDVNRIHQGDQALCVNPNGGTVAVEYTKTRVGDAREGVKKSKYFGFSGTQSNMILTGEWETKPCETHSVDGIGWSSKRKRVNAYVTMQGQAFEMSYCWSKYPVAFVRVPNIQQGKVSGSIQFNLAADNTLLLHNGNGYVPQFTHVSSLMSANIVKEIELIINCLSCGRIVYDAPLTGTVFPIAIDNLTK